jgi:hypothetical protein
MLVGIILSINNTYFHMPSKNKWILGIVVVIVVVLGYLWSNGTLGGAASEQPAAVNNGIGAPRDAAATDASIKNDVAAIDAQIRIVDAGVTSLGKSPTKAQLSSVAAGFQTVNGLMVKLSTKLQSRIVNAKTAGNSYPAATAALSDAVNQLGNMTSQASVAEKNATATSSSTTLQTSLTQLKTAQTYMKAARADVQTALQALGIK